MKNFTLNELRESIPAQISENPVRYLFPMWLDSRGDKGGYLFNTSTEALEFKKREIQRAESNLEFQKKEREQFEAAKQKELDLINSYGGFLDKSLMKAGKQRKTLERVISNNGVVSTRKEMIERKLREEYKLELVDKYKSVRGTSYLERDGDKKEWALVKEGYTLSLNITEKEYAEYLINKKN